ncbi:Crp/Fnr family transcriptional regulator [Roseimarinus sediminis]|uniref:Crp/Fnr family transcriptional regulator n=1 Tax=Roseimarinus sediminis TaxID=1610899 RepID=UPI003D1C99E5
MPTNTSIPYSCSFSFSEALIFDMLTAEELELIHKNSIEVRYKSGEMIFKQGTFATHIGLLTEGLAKMFIADNNSEQKLILKILPPINLLGISFLSEENSVFFYSCQAYIDSTVELIDIKILRQIIGQNASFGKRIIDIMCEHTLINYGRFFCLTNKQTYGRMADVLLCLANRIYKKTSFDLELSRKELAELAGMSIESTTRILTKFKEEKLISIKGKNIEIIDATKLVEISQKG